MDIETHYKKFKEIIEKYKLSDDDKASEIAHFLTNTKKREEISAKEFAKLFAMTEDEALIFLSYIEKGINFKKNHIDKE